MSVEERSQGGPQNTVCRRILEKVHVRTDGRPLTKVLFRVWKQKKKPNQLAHSVLVYVPQIDTTSSSLLLVVELFVVFWPERSSEKGWVFGQN